MDEGSSPFQNPGAGRLVPTVSVSAFTNSIPSGPLVVVGSSSPQPTSPSSATAATTKDTITLRMAPPIGSAQSVRM